MITASEAKKICDSVDVTYSSNTTEEILSLIRKNAQLGLDVVDYRRELDEEDKSALYRLGYEIMDLSTIGGKRYIVSWAKATYEKTNG